MYRGIKDEGPCELVKIFIIIIIAMHVFLFDYMYIQSWK